MFKGEFIGRYDKNGNKIFEGSTVKYGRNLYRVYYDVRRHAFKLFPKNFYDPKILPPFLAKDILDIDSVYEVVEDEKDRSKLQ